MDCDGLEWSRPNYQDETHTVCLYNTSMICTHITTNFAEKKLCICTLFVWFHMVQVQGSNQMYAFLQKKKNVHVPSSMVYTSISDEIRVERCGQSLTDRCPQHLTARQDWLRLESWIRVTRWCQGRTIQTTTCSYQQQRDRNVGPIPPNVGQARSYS